MGYAWFSLVIAGLFEIGWPIGLKNGWSDSGFNLWWIVFAILCMTVSGVLLLYAQKSIPIGTAYAVWTGIGAAGTFLVGVAFYGDAMSVVRMLSILFILVGVAGLKMA